MRISRRLRSGDYNDCLTPESAYLGWPLPMSGFGQFVIYEVVEKQFPAYERASFFFNCQSDTVGKNFLRREAMFICPNRRSAKPRGKVLTDLDTMVVRLLRRKPPAPEIPIDVEEFVGINIVGIAYLRWFNGAGPKIMRGVIANHTIALCLSPHKLKPIPWGSI